MELKEIRGLIKRSPNIEILNKIKVEFDFKNINESYSF